jgi:hypothetical protein
VEGAHDLEGAEDHEGEGAGLDGLVVGHGPSYGDPIGRLVRGGGLRNSVS